ncbi:MAG: IS4 family transposase [Steroidobacteraceae bacterium]
MAAGAESVEWVGQEFAGIDLGDKRLDRRLVKTATMLAKNPGAPINEACRTWAAAQGAYRLFDNRKASPEAIRAPHVRETIERIRQLSGPVLAVQDTVFYSYGQHPRTKGLGPIGKSNSAHERGLCVHNALAFTTSGVPLGILSQNIWARQPVPEEEHQEKIERLQVTPIEEKESFKWLRAMRETRSHALPRSKLILVADRESDFWELLTEARQEAEHFLIRARVDRKLVPEESECCESIQEALACSEVLGHKTVSIPGNGKRKAREAQLQVRVTQVTIKPPQRRGQAKASASIEPITVRVIGATEVAPPEGQEAVSWVLLTDLPVADFASACEKIDWYGKRWGIETWHKVLKSGCTVESCLLETAERLARYLALFSVIGVRLMHVAYLARVQPDICATEVFAEEEIEALHVRVHHALPPAQSPTLREVVRMIGSLGGHLGRKGDGEPGMTVIWRGWLHLYETVIALRAARVAGLINSS